MKLVAVLCLLAAEAVHVYALPGGAPSQACTGIEPTAGSPHVGTNPPNSANMSNNPFRLDLSGFVCPAGVVGYCYNPGQTYQITLSGANNEQFRGFLVQGRQVADASPVGAFSSFTPNTRASDCTPAESAVTHRNRNDKTSEVLTWTAPSSGTGPVLFQWAVVVIYQAGTANEWYAPLQTQAILENDTCPLLNITNGMVSYQPPGTPPDVGAVATYTCDDGFILRGNSMRTCGGMWTGSDPACIRYCPLLNVGNGTVSYQPDETPPTVGAEATYACNMEYVLEGNSMRTCDDNGTWTGSDPECIRTCEEYMVENGEVEYTPPGPPFREGTIGMTTCNAGLTLFGNATRICQDNGNWTDFTMCGAPFTTAVSLWLLLTLLAATYLL